MGRLSMTDMNSLNAIAGALRVSGHKGFANRIYRIQAKATEMLQENESVLMLKTVKVTNPRNVLVQIPAFVISQWNLNVDSRLEVSYNECTGQVTIQPSVQGRGNSVKES